MSGLGQSLPFQQIDTNDRNLAPFSPPLKSPKFQTTPFPKLTSSRHEKRFSLAQRSTPAFEWQHPMGCARVGYSGLGSREPLR